jgi:predicted Zn-dependent protease with MMP-like domain
MTRTEFEAVVKIAVAEFEQRHPGMLDNVVIIIEDDHNDLLGLYEGVPRSERTFQEPWMTPDKITLYRKPICEEAEDEGCSVEQMIREVFAHEVAHYLGHDEDGAERIEENSTAR